MLNQDITYFKHANESMLCFQMKSGVGRNNISIKIEHSGIVFDVWTFLKKLLSWKKAAEINHTYCMFLKSINTLNDNSEVSNKSWADHRFFSPNHCECHDLHHTIWLVSYQVCQTCDGFKPYIFISLSNAAVSPLLIQKDLINYYVYISIITHACMHANTHNKRSGYASR